jgi:hypothetical protein
MLAERRIGIVEREIAIIHATPEDQTVFYRLSGDSMSVPHEA